MAIILKYLRHSNWSEEKEASEEWNTYSRRYELLVEQDILKTSTHYPSGNPPSHFPEFAEFDKVQDNSGQHIILIMYYQTCHCFHHHLITIYQVRNDNEHMS